MVSAGNSGAKSGNPATAERVLDWGLHRGGEIAEFSSYNPERDNPDVAAIGKDNRLVQAAGTNTGQELDGPWIQAS